MQDSGSMPQRSAWAGMPKTKPAGTLPASMPANLIPQVAESPLTPLPHTQSPMPDGVECLDSHRAFVAVSPAMREVRRQLEQVAGIDGVVLLLGESGTGKEVVARMIHKLSWRASREFVKVNCAALPVELLESELFGREAGVSGDVRPDLAEKDQAGKFETCNKGTILLDEIAALPISSQAKLLHLLQDGEFSRLGSASTIRADVRVLAATNADVRQAMQNGTLRPDLYYRLNVFPIHLPPLRERREDLPHLLNHFMNTWAAAYDRPRLPITRRILEFCASYPWPGNVRELENFVKRYLVMSDENLALSQLDYRPESGAASVQVDNPPAHQPAAQSGGCDLKTLVRDLKQEAERAAIVRALEQTGGNKQEAAILLRISLRGLHYKVRAYAIESIPQGQECTAARGNPPLRPLPPVPAYPLTHAVDGSPQFAAPGNGKLAGQGNGKLTSSGNGKLISMDRTSYLPVR